MGSCRFRSTFLSSSTTFDTSCAARIRTAPAINYTAYWQLAFIHIRLFVIYLAYIFYHCQPAPTYPRSINLFCFLSVGNPKTVLKGGYSGRKGGSSFESIWFERWLVWACKCAYDCAMPILFFIFLYLNHQTNNY